MLANSSLPYSRYLGIVLLEEIIVSNSPIDWQDLGVKDFIHIALVCIICNTMQIKLSCHAKLKVAFFF